jgi:NAD-dependent deacetylase
MTSNDAERYEHGARLWHDAEYAVAFTGAGISVPSGIPDFRSPGGLWSRFDPMQVATAEALASNPKGVWEFLLETVEMLETAAPNPAHEALAEMERIGRIKGVITQNIDNLHQRAGSREVVEYHGNFQRFYCMRCRRDAGYEEVRRRASRDAIPLQCTECGGMIRPDVVFFGESIPSRAQTRSWEHIGRADLIIIAGTSGEVAPANMLPHQVKRSGGKVIEINLGSTGYSDISDVRFDAPVQEVLPRLARMVEG